MKRSGVVCLSMVVALSAAHPAEAGRGARRAARTTAIVAGATGAAAVVAAAPRRTTVVAAAPVVVAKPVPAALAPDLTVTDVAAEGDDLCVTVKNIGQVASPQSRLQIDVNQTAGGALVARQIGRVRPLAVNQSVRIRLHSAPIAGVRAIALADPRHELAELNERNNDMAVTFAALVAESVVSAPPTLEDVGAWGGIEFQASVGTSIGAGN